jgi:hypothetical protein
MPNTLTKKMRSPLWLAGAAVLFLSAPPAAGWAQEAARPARPAPKAASKAPPPAQAPGGGTTDPATGTTTQDPKVTVERGAGGKKVYRITESLRIEGKIQKPEAFYVLQKSSINYDWQDLKQDFVPKILESVAAAPF